MKKKILTVLMAFLLVLGNIIPAFAQNNTVITDMNKLDIQQGESYIEIDITDIANKELRRQEEGRGRFKLFGVTNTAKQDVKIKVNLELIGLNNGEFDENILMPILSSLKITPILRYNDGRKEELKTIDRPFGLLKNHTEFNVPAEKYNNNLRHITARLSLSNAALDTFNNNAKIEAFETTSQLTPGSVESSILIKIYQIASPKVQFEYRDVDGEILVTVPSYTAKNFKLTFASGVEYETAILQENTIKSFKAEIDEELDGVEALNHPDNPSLTIDGKTSGELLNNGKYTIDFATSYDVIKGGKVILTVKPILTNNLAPQDIIVNQGDDIDWSKGVKPKEELDTLLKEEIKKVLAKAKVTDITSPVRTSESAGEKEGTLKVTLEGGSTIEVPNQKLIVKSTKIDTNFDDAQGTADGDAPRDGEEVVKGKISAKDLNLKGAVVIIKDSEGNVIGTTLADDNGNFIAGTRPLKAGETVKVEVKPAGFNTPIHSTDKIVKLNPDELNKIIEIASKVLKNYENKKFVNKDKYEALVDAVNGNSSKSIEGGKDLVYIDGEQGIPQDKKAGDLKIEEPTDLTDGTDKQGRIDTAYENIKTAIEKLIGNYIPVIKGPDHKEIYVGDTLDLTEGITVTDEDSTKDESDIAQQDGKDFSYKVYTTNSENQKVEVKGDALKNLNSTPGTYEVVYMAKDKSGATATHEMTLVVKEAEVTAIKVTTDPTKDQKYLVKDKDTKATPDYTDMQVELTYNNGKKETATYDATSKKFKNDDKEVAELTVAPTQVGVVDSPKVITATYEKGSTKLTDNAGKAIIVQVDSDGNGKADESEKFDINYATSFEVVTKPQLKYTVNSSKETATLDLSALLVKVTDTKGNVKYYTWENIKTEDKIKVTLTKKGEGEQAVEVSKIANTELTPKLLNTDEATKATKPFIENHNDAELKVVVDLVKVENGKVVYETDGKTLKRETDVNKTTKSAGKLSVLVDKDKNGKNDLEETTDKPFITSAKNIPTSNEDKTPKTEVTGHAKPGVKIEIKAVGDNGKPTGKVLGKVDSVGADGTYKVTLDPQQKAGTKVVATATEGEKKPSTSDPKAVIDDMDQDGNDDSKQGFNISKATKIEFYEEPNLTYLVKEKTTEVTFDGKDAEDNEISVKISYEENGKTLSNVYKLSELNTKDFEGIVEITPAIGTKDKIGNNPANLVGKNLVVKLKNVVEKQGATEDQKTAATATSTSKFAIEIDADGNGKVDKNEKTEMPAIISARNVKNATQQDKIETKVKVKALVGATVTINDENGKVVSDAVKVPVNGSEKYGEVEITLKEKQDAGKKVKAIAKLGEKQPSEPAESIVFEDLDGNGKPDGQGQLDIENIVEFKLASNPDKMKYPLKATDAQETLDLTGLMVYLKDKNGNTGIFEYNKKAESPFEELKNNANFKLQLINSQNEATDIKDKATEKTKLSTADDLSKVKVTLQIPNSNGQGKVDGKSVETSQLEVFLDANGDGERDTDQTPAPKDLKALNKGTDAFTTITGKAQAGDVIKVYDEDGKEITTDPATVTVGADGTFTIKVSKDSKALPENTKLFVTAKANDKEESPRTPVFVKVDKDGNGIADEDEQSAKPTDVKALNQNKVVDGKVTNEPKDTTTVTGKVKPGATVKITSEDGKTDLTPSKVTIDNEGNFSAEIARQTVETEIKVWATEQGKQESDPEPATVVRDANNDGIDDSKFSDKPSVKTPVKNGDKTVEVNGKPNAKAYVVITDKDGNETTTPVVDLDGQGKGTINVPELKDGQKVKVVQTEEGKKPVESDPVVVKPNTTDDNLENNITKAEEKAGNLIDDPNSTADPKDKIRENLDQKSSTDKELQDALEKANEEKEKANKVDQNGKQTPQNTQKDVDDANDRLKKALDEKDKYDKAKKAVDDAKAEWNSIKDKTDPAPTEQEYKNVKDKIDAAQKAIDDLNDKNGTADNTDKPALQKELDKIYLDKVIKQGDEKLKEQGLDPTEKAKLDNAVKQGKDTQGKLNDTDTSNNPNHDMISDDIKAIEDALNPKGKTDAPTIDSAIIGGTKITGTAPANSVVTVKLGDKVLGKVDADSQGKWSISTEALQEGQVVKAQAQETNKTPSDEVTKTVGLDTSKLKESIAEAEKIGGTDGKNLDENKPYDKKLKDALKTAKEEAKLGDENNTTQGAIDQAKKDLDNAMNKKDADEKVKVVEDKVKKGEKPSPDEIQAAQDAIDKIDGSKTPGDKDFDQDKKDLQDRLDKAKALDELKDAKGALDKAIDKAEEEKKPKDETDKAKKESKKADEIIKDGGSGKTADDLVKEVENIKEITKKLGQPAIQITIDSAINNSSDLILTTNPGRCKVNITIYYDNGGEKKYEETTDPNGVASIKLEKPLQVDDFIKVTATKKLNPTDESDYLDNSTSTYVG